MVAEIVTLAPIAVEGADPGDALARPPLHLQHVRHRMRAPDVVRMDLHGAAPCPLGALVLARFLQGESPGAEDVAVARDAFVPREEAAPERIPHRAGLAEIEPEILRHLHRD